MGGRSPRRWQPRRAPPPGCPSEGAARLPVLPIRLERNARQADRLNPGRKHGERRQAGSEGRRALLAGASNPAQTEERRGSGRKVVRKTKGVGSRIEVKQARTRRLLRTRHAT